MKVKVRASGKRKERKADHVVDNFVDIANSVVAGFDRRNRWQSNSPFVGGSPDCANNPAYYRSPSRDLASQLGIKFE
jgi:hypothetical protein